MADSEISAANSQNGRQRWKQQRKRELAVALDRAAKAEVCCTVNCCAKQGIVNASILWQG